jgi:hypothetical protein
MLDAKVDNVHVKRIDIEDLVGSKKMQNECKIDVRRDKM